MMTADNARHDSALFSHSLSTPALFKAGYYPTDISQQFKIR